MDQVDKDTIQRNIVRLSSLVDLDVLYRELLQRNIIDQNFIERIKVEYRVPEDRAQEFFLRYTKRGPLAFQVLVESLEKIGHISEANILKARQAASSSTGNINSPSRNEPGTNGHLFQLSPTSSSSPSSSTSVPSSPLMRSHLSRVEPLSGTNSPTSSSSSISGAEQFPRLSLSSCSMDDLPPLVVRVRQAENYNMGKHTVSPGSAPAVPYESVDNKELAYQMMSNPRGFALIINNIEFIGDAQAKRDGAEKDTAHLEQLLKQFGFEVMIRHNVKKMELIHPDTGILKKFIDQFKNDKKNVDACVVAIMSHGKEDHAIRAHDAEDNRNPSWNYWNFYEEILKKFNNRHCPVLIGKPKLFIVQACQGERRDRGVQRTRVDGKDLTSGEASNGILDELSKPLEKLPETEDMIVCFSTVPGLVSNRDIEHGTWYIHSLCKVFMEHAWNTELLQLLKIVGREMRKLTSEYGHKQMSSFTVLGFHYDLYFNPGLFENSEAPPENNGLDEDSASAIVP